MTLIEIHNKILQHLLQQGEPASAGPNSCSYRAEKNGKKLMCAVGCLISDAAYNPFIEGHGVFSNFVMDALKESGVTANGKVGELLQAWQSAHDSFVNPRIKHYLLFDLESGDWPTHIKNCAVLIAQHFNLTPKETT